MVLRTGKMLIMSLLWCSCFLTACEDFYIVDCDKCELIEPITCTLRIELGEVLGSNTLYDVTIYRGKIEDGVVIYNVTSHTSVNYTVGLNSEYTVTASVVINGKEYTAVDSTRPRVDVITNSCEETCYWVVNNTVNLKIKYY